MHAIHTTLLAGLSLLFYKKGRQYRTLFQAFQYLLYCFEMFGYSAYEIIEAFIAFMRECKLIGRCALPATAPVDRGYRNAFFVEVCN